MADPEKQSAGRRGSSSHPPNIGFTRRASLSLPDLDILARIQEVVEEQREREEAELDEGGLDQTAEESETSDISDGNVSERSEDTEDSSSKLPLRRKSKSIPPRLSIVNSNFLKSEPLSPNTLSASSTSINSITSLLKERLVMTIPGILKHKRPREYKLQAFVAFLFIAIVFLVGFAYVFYHEQVLQRAYFERIRFTQEERKIRVFNRQGVEVLSGSLGVLIPSRIRGYQCMDGRVLSEDDDICLEWEDHGRLAMHKNTFESESVRCYRIFWQSLSENVRPTDCYDMSEKRGVWYGGGEVSLSGWPLGHSEIPMSEFVTGDKTQYEWGNVLSKYFINSRGAALTITSDTPLYVSVNEDGDERLCLQAAFNEFTYYYNQTTLPTLNYTICTADDIVALHNFRADKNLWDGGTKRDIEDVYELLQEPVWHLSLRGVGQEAILNHSDSIEALGFLEQGTVLLDEFWQPCIGDLVMDESRFPTVDNIFQIIHRRGFKIAATVQPFFSTDSINYHEGLKNELWLHERHGSVPALTQYKSLSSAAMLDVTKNYSLTWMEDKIRTFMSKYQIDSLYLDLGTAYNLPFYYKPYTPLSNPDDFLEILTLGLSTHLQVIATSSATVRPRLPGFVALSPLESTWTSLRKLIPTMLSLGTVGYPFLLPSAVGGDVLPAGVSLPPRELFVRWMQVAHFLPVLQFSILPSEYDTKMVELGRNLTRLRKALVVPLTKKYAEEAMNSCLPIIRPLWMLDPSDQNCLKVADEFSIGNELLVAPILDEGAREREVYLPKGVWKDGLDGSLRKGERWIHNHRVREDQIAHFIRMPDGTRLTPTLTKPLQ